MLCTNWSLNGHYSKTILKYALRNCHRLNGVCGSGAAIHASHGYNVRSVVHCAHFKEQARNFAFFPLVLRVLFVIHSASAPRTPYLYGLRVVFLTNGIAFVCCVNRAIDCPHQIYFCPIEKANFVDMSAFDELERDVLWYNRIILRRVFNAFKTHYKLKAVLNRVETGSLREGTPAKNTANPRSCVCVAVCFVCDAIALLCLVWCPCRHCHVRTQSPFRVNPKQKRWLELCQSRSVAVRLRGLIRMELLKTKSQARADTNTVTCFEPQSSVQATKTKINL